MAAAGAWNLGDGDKAVAPPEGAQWAALIDNLLRGLERGSKQWTSARKKDSLRRLLEANRSNATRLHERITQLMRSWDGEEDSSVETLPGELGQAQAAVAASSSQRPVDPHGTRGSHSADASALRAVAVLLCGTVQTALARDEPRACELGDRLGVLVQRLGSDGAATQLQAEVAATCQEAQRVLVQRHHLLDSLGNLARELAAGLTDLAEDESWARGQAETMQARLGPAEGASLPSVRSVRATQDLLAQTRRQQQKLKAERDRARHALKGLVDSLVTELGALGGRTGQYGKRLGDYAATIEQAASVEGLYELVQQMLHDNRAVQSEVAGASTRLQSGHVEASRTASRVLELEGELSRLSEEASTDALTQVANRRGLAQAFEAETARHAREGGTLAVALIDIDHFKKLNDSFGHNVGDEALKLLVARVRAALRPIDHVARFGGEEFVLLLPSTELAEAQRALTRLQRDLTASLFLHEGREVFVTFSGGVTAWRHGEALDAAIERADEALYEAKRNGRNRTCVG